MPPSWLAVVATVGVAATGASWIFGESSTGPVVGGAAGLVGLLAMYLLRELNRSSGGSWRVVRDKNGQIHRKDWEISFWQNKADPGRYDDPGPYRPPTDQELKTW